MSDWYQQGKHWLRRDGDAVFWRVLGDIDLDEMHGYLLLGERVIAEHGRTFLLMDTAHARSVSAEARRFQAEWLRTHDASRGRTVLYGASVMLRALMLLIVRTSQIFAKQTPRIDVVASEREALAWLAAQRVSFQPGPWPSR